MRSSNWAEAAIPVIYKFFDVGLNLRPHLRPALYNIQRSTLSKEEHIGVGGISPDSWDLYETSDSGNKAEVQWDKGYQSTATHREYVVTFNLERKLADDDQYGLFVQQRARRLGMSAAQKLEIDAASTFANAFTGTSGPDSLSLCHASHPYSPDNTNDTQGNTGTTALSNTAISETRTLMMKFVDDVGNPLGIVPNLILVPPDLEDTGLTALGDRTSAPLDPDSGNNAFNPQVGRFILQPWHQLADVNNWFMIDTVWMDESLMWYEHTPLEIMLVDETTTYWQYEAYMRYSHIWTDYRWIYGHAV